MEYPCSVTEHAAKSAFFLMCNDMLNNLNDAMHASVSWWWWCHENVSAGRCCCIPRRLMETAPPVRKTSLFCKWQICVACYHLSSCFPTPGRSSPWFCSLPSSQEDWIHATEIQAAWDSLGMGRETGAKPKPMLKSLCESFILTWIS